MQKEKSLPAEKYILARRQTDLNYTYFHSELLQDARKQGVFMKRNWYRTSQSDCANEYGVYSVSQLIMIIIPIRNDCTSLLIIHPHKNFYISEGMLSHFRYLAKSVSFLVKSMKCLDSPSHQPLFLWYFW